MEGSDIITPPPLPPSREASSPYYECESGLLLADEQKLVGIKQPHHHDVLSGRGVTTNRHPGNESFRSLVALNKEVYVSSTKRHKMSISKSIVEAVRSLDPPGRFLEKDPANGLWSDIGHKKALEKTSQALRDGAASLRRQLSADMGDPDFLNAVFGDNDESSSSAQEKVRTEKTTIEGKGTAKMGSKSNRAAAPKPLRGKQLIQGEKLVTAKKAKQEPVKKGHRRTRSNPCLGTASTKHHKRVKPTGPPPSPLVRLAERFPQMPPSPMSPPPRHSASHPNSPMTWGVGTPYGEEENQGSFVPTSPYHYNDHPPPPSPYAHQPGHGHYNRSNSYEYYQDPREESRSHHPHSHPWSYGASPYGERPPPSPSSLSVASSSNHQYAWHGPPPPHHHAGCPPSENTMSPRPPRSSSPTPASPLPRGPLPPGRHQFSPAGYRTTLARPDWRSPREPSHAHERYERDYRPSPRYSYEHGYPVEWSPQWRSPHSQDYYATPPSACYSTSASGSAESNERSGLTVPSLGVESRYPSKHSLSSRVALSPRSRRSPGETPPRPPTCTSSARDFAPPPPSPRFRCIRRPKERSHPWEREDSYMSSPPGEEKKTEHDQEDSVPYRSVAGSSSPSRLKLRVRESSPPAEDTIKEEEENEVLDKSDDTPATCQSSSSLVSVYRSSPMSARISVVAAGTEASAKVEDIAMSPIPRDREDPSTLMELPEDIMTLPISPCGPNDDPLASA